MQSSQSSLIKNLHEPTTLKNTESALDGWTNLAANGTKIQTKHVNSFEEENFS